jgi:hypothetical protein
MFKCIGYDVLPLQPKNSTYSVFQILAGKRIHLFIPIALNFFLHDRLIVCNTFQQIYDAGDFSVLCSVTAPRGERWMAGEFLAADRVILWSDEGHGYLYKLPAK